MRLLRAGRLHPLALMGLLSLVVFSITCWLWFARVADRVVASLNQQTGLTFVDHPVTFDPFQRRLSVSDIQIREDDIRLSVQQASFVLNYRHWWGAWFGEPVESLSAVELVGADMVIDPERFTFSVPDWFQALSIKSGTLAITGISQPVPFHQLTVTKEGSHRLGLNLTGNFDRESAGEGWRFSGLYQVSRGLLTGELKLEGQPLPTLFAFLPSQHPVSLNQPFFTADTVTGNINATLWLSWDKQGGLLLRGSAEGQHGQIAGAGFTAKWQGWQLDNVQFNASDSVGSATGLTLSGLDLTMDAPGGASAIITRLREDLPFSIDSVSVHSGRFELGSGSDLWLFENVNGGLRTGHGGAESATRSYQVTAALAGVGEFRLDGELAETSETSQNDFTLHLKDAYLAGPFKKYAVLLGYNLTGTQFNLSYNSKSHRGQLDIVGWKYKKNGNTSGSTTSIDLLRALLTDPSGKSTIRFSLNPVTSLATLPKGLHLAADQRLTAIARAPFDYLVQATGQALNPVLHHEAGKATLTARAYANMERLQKVLAQRPKLRVGIHVGVSASGDWPELSRFQLEEALQELYSAMGAVSQTGSSTMPSEVRAHLLEQMYLATRQQKIPEVGELSPAQRVQKAEQWLLENWPKTPDQIEVLRQARYDLLHDVASRIGIDGQRIELRMSSGSGGDSVEPESVVTLH